MDCSLFTFDSTVIPQGRFARLQIDPMRPSRITVADFQPSRSASAPRVVVADHAFQFSDPQKL